MPTEDKPEDLKFDMVDPTYGEDFESDPSTPETTETVESPEAVIDDAAIEAGLPDAEVEGEPSALPPAEGTTAPIEGEGQTVADVDPGLMDLAARHGFSEDEAKAFGSQDALRRAVATLDSKMVQWAERQFMGITDSSTNGQPAPQPQQPQQPMPPVFRPQEQPTQGLAKEPAPAFEKFKVELDPALFDAETIKIVNGLNDHYDNAVRKLAEDNNPLKAEVAQLKTALEQFTGHMQAEASTRTERELDAFFSSLGDEYKAVYGDGPLRGLAPGAPAVKARQDFFTKMQLLQMADAYQNQPPLSDAAMRERVLAFQNSGLIKTSVRKEIQTEIDKRRKQSISRPSSRGTKPLTGEARAIQRAREFAKTHTANWEDPAPDEL